MKTIANSEYFQKKISELYFKYGLLNNTIDSGHQHMISSNRIPRNFYPEVIRLCKVIFKKSDEVLEKLS